MARLFVTLPEDLHDKLRIKSIETKNNHRELVVEALEQYLDFVSQDKFSQPVEEDNETESSVVEGQTNDETSK